MLNSNVKESSFKKAEEVAVFLTDVLLEMPRRRQFAVEGFYNNATVKRKVRIHPSRLSGLCQNWNRTWIRQVYGVLKDH